MMLNKEVLVKEFRLYEENGAIYVDRPRKGKTNIEDLISTIRTNHKYGEDREYQIYQLRNYDKNKTANLTKHRLLYAWYIGEIPDGYDVDHIDDNPNNNSLDNLQIMTHKDNIAKRGKGKNQYSAAKERGIQVECNMTHSKEFLDKKAKADEFKNYKLQFKKEHSEDYSDLRKLRFKKAFLVKKEKKLKEKLEVLYSAEKINSKKIRKIGQDIYSLSYEINQINKLIETKTRDLSEKLLLNFNVKSK